MEDLQGYELKTYNVMANIKLDPKEKKVSINFSIKQKHKDDFIMLCKKNGRSQSSIGEALILDFIASEATK